MVWKYFFHALFSKLSIKRTIVLIPSMTQTMFVKVFILMILLNSSWFNTGRFINNTLFLLYITDDSRYFIGFNCFYITPITISFTNTINLWCNSTCYKTNILGERKWIFLMPQMTITISDVFDFPDKIILIKWTNIVIEVRVLSPE